MLNKNLEEKYNLNIDDFIDYITYYYHYGNLYWEDLDWEDEKTTKVFLKDFSEDILNYLTEYGLEDAGAFSDCMLDDIYDSVVTRMVELGKIKKL